MTHSRYQVVDFVRFDVDPKDILVPASIQGKFACIEPFESQVILNTNQFK